jgi:sec-independent protein translocase protein TatA
LPLGLGESIVPTLGFGELVVILILTILVFGAVRIPKIGADLGKMVRSFKRGMDHEEKIQISRDPSDKSLDQGPVSKSKKQVNP